VFGAVAVAALASASCRTDMHVQPRYNPLDATEFFEDGRSARPEVPGTVARGHLRIDQHLYAGKVNGTPVDSFPFPITHQVLARGQERFNIYCTPCHGFTGEGRGMIVQRGFPPPPSYHVDRLRQAPVGHFYDVITNGYGAMYSHAARIGPEDRWAIVAYIRALQMSQHATLDDVPETERTTLTAQPR
jgi:mono/diheme cytochrome c family protein